MKSGEMTAIQRQSVEHVARAKAEGLSLSTYAQAHGISARQVYDATSQLRRAGVLPRAAMATQPKFVAVKIASPPPGSAAVCRITMAAGLTIECAQWPPRSWLASLAGADAAA